MVAVLPLHPNPKVRAEVRAALGAAERVVLCEPLPYAQFGRMLGRAYCTVTDSGGVQEEAPALGVPALDLVTGGSLGGMVSLEVALERPTAVRAVAPIAAPCPPPAIAPMIAPSAAPMPARVTVFVV